jgi:hypothetical protein
MRIYLCLSILVLAIQANGQHKYDYTWMFGPRNPDLGTILKFGDDAVTFEKGDFIFHIGTGTTIISNQFGELQYYSAGCSIANADHEIVPGADTLNPGWFYDNYCYNGFPYPSGDHSMVFLPFEGDRYNLIYKYTNIDFLGSGMVNYINDTIYMASITKGELNFANKPLMHDTLSFGSLAAVKHANNVDYWLVTPHDSSNIYFSIHISSNGVEEVNEQVVGGVWRRDHNGVITKFSPDGTMYVGFEPTYLEQTIKVFSFNSNSGALALSFTLPYPEEDKSLVGGIEFSPQVDICMLAPEISFTSMI